MRSCASGLIFSSLVVWFAACGGAAPPPAEPAPPPEPAVPAPAPVAKAPPAPAEPTDDDAASASASASAKKKDEDPNAQREVTYTVVPEGLKVAVAGVKFNVAVGAAPVGAGWGVFIKVTANANDGKPHSLTNPKAGPLAFAGTVTRKGKSEPEHFGDERAGDGDLAIFGDDPTKFSRTWPPKGVGALTPGDSLDLQIALWGLGTETDSRRPVKQFCHVRMQVDKGKPRAIVEPPSSVASK